MDRQDVRRTGESSGTPSGSSATNSTFGEGDTIMRHAQSGPIGKFYQALLSLGPDIDLKLFQLPKLICIGEQNTGKSSTLESITNCPIFPRGDSTTTRAPVFLRMTRVPEGAASAISFTVEFGSESRRLQHQEDIKDAVKHYMDSIPAQTFSDVPIIVNICKPDVPTMEIIDLPGIVSRPAAAEQKTEAIVQQYLRDPATLVLCVVSAFCDHVDGSQAVGLVEKAGKQHKTIITLTKADELSSPQMIQRKLVNRMLKTSDEQLSVFADIAGVINRSHFDRPHLIEQGSEEQDTLQSKLLSKLPADMQQHAPLLRQNVTIANLIRRIEHMFRNHVKTEWVPRALARLREDPIRAAEAAYTALGPAPGRDLSIAQVMQHIQPKLHLNELARTILEEPRSSIRSDMAIALASSSLAGGIDEGSTSTAATRHLENAGSWFQCEQPGTLQYACQLREIADCAKAAIETWLSRAPYMQLIRRKVQQAFRSDDMMHLHRFQSLQQEILDVALPRLINVSRIRDSLVSQLQHEIDMLGLGFCGSQQPQSQQAMPIPVRLAALSQAVHMGVVQQAIMPLIAGFSDCIPDTFQLEESPEYAAQRRTAQDRLDNLCNAVCVIQNIEHDMDNVRQPSLASSSANPLDPIDPFLGT